MASNEQVKLPEKLSDLKSIFPGLTFEKILKSSQNPDNFSTDQSLVWKYAGGALLAGRPLNSTMIFMGGISGAGKSSTINVLFDDPTLCGTSSNATATKDVVLIKKQLKVNGDKLPVVGNLNFVDVPGTFDTDSRNEAMNLAATRKFVDDCVELASRKGLASQIPERYFDLSETTFPNIVLFALKATDNRMTGPNTFFRKSLQVLKDTAQLVDLKRPNLIIVLTNAMSLPRKKERFIAALEEKTENVRQVVFEVLGIKDVDVVPVENEGEGYDMEKSGDFYMFPDGQLSHYNLFNAMIKRFDSNKDLLARIQVGWYFSASCPEKKNQAEIVKPDVDVSKADIAIAENELADLRIPTVENEQLTPYFHFQSFGRGYCPVTEEVKPVSLITDEDSDANAGDKWQPVKIENSKFLIPKRVTPYVKSRSVFHSNTYFDKVQYEGHMKSSYGLEADIKLKVAAASEGRWVNEGRLSTALISLIQEIQVATFKLDNPKKHIVSKVFLQELDNLPETYSTETASRFEAFFSKWGTHIIYEQSLGGAIQLNTIAQKSGLTDEKLKEIEGKVSGMYRAFSHSGEGSYEKNSKVMQEAGLSNESFQIDGGNSPGMVTLASINSKFLDDWTKSVAGRPAEIRKTIKLYPYYNLLDSGSKYDSLRQATKDYLENTFKSRVKGGNEQSRDKVGHSTVERAADMSGENCFPMGTQILLQKGSSMAIENLHWSCNEDISTLQLKSGMSAATFSLQGSQGDKGGTCGTQFCTYLDYKKDIRVEYLVFRFSNGKELRVSEAHLIFEFLGGNVGQIRGKQAKYFKVGEMMVYFSQEESQNGGATGFETPFIQEIGRETLIGAFSPLTTSGTFFADGFLVTSYANIDSFSTAQASLLPLKMWSQMKNRKGKKIAENLKPNGLDGAKEMKTEWNQGIHPYAQCLTDFRKSIKTLIPSFKNNN